MTSPARPSCFSCAKRRSIRVIAPHLPSASRWAPPSPRKRGEGLTGATPPSSPSPRLRGEGWGEGQNGSQPDPEMVGDGEDVLVAAAAHVHHQQVVARQGRRDLGDMREGMRRLQRRDDALLPAAQLKRLKRLAVGDRDVFDATEIVKPGML